ncbi:hypothetical protein MXD81_17850, partial [Microbacteriaceae bacterium K1510]|nr:hypothetical protein [Microbacteriaceae bacterium K1510]
IFIKEVKLPGVEKSFMVKQAVGTNQPIGGWTAFFSTGLEMARTLSAWSSHAGNHAQTGPFPEVESNALKEKHRLFLEASRAVEPPADWQPLFSGMVNG